MTATEIREKYLKSMESHGYKRITPAPLVLTDDPTTLFTAGGMQPLVPNLLGRSHPDGELLTNSQPCIRTQDMEEVGDNRHTTFFEMLGDWSLNGFDKEEQIRWLFDFLTKDLGLQPEKLYITCFIGDEKAGVPRDNETAEIWQKIFAENGIETNTAEIGTSENGNQRGMNPNERIFFYDDNENWWSRGGNIATTPVGDPCGPDNEVFYDFGEEVHDASFGQPHPASDSGRFVEICNKVFMQYEKLPDGGVKLLGRGKIDFGGGLSRLASAVLGKPDIFLTSLYQPIIEKLENLSGKDYASNQASMRVIADHLTAATWLAAQNLKPSNKEQGYVMRRLIRRAIRFAFDLGIEQNFLEEIVPTIAGIYADSYAETFKNLDEIVAVLMREEKAFRQTLRKGLKEFNRIAERKLFANTDSPAAIMTGREIFTLYDTYGFPKELSAEEAFKRDIRLTSHWPEEFDDEMQKQREMSQTAAKGTFKGGLGGQTWQHRRYHTATHLLQSALRQIFGEQLRQHGSNITEERLRFDFNLDRKMTPDEITKAEELVNGWIAADLPIFWREYPTETALEMGAIGPFGERYGDKVKVYQMGAENSGFATDKKLASLEICGGPHCERTGQLATNTNPDDSTDSPQNENNAPPTPRDQMTKEFKIVKEESTAAGIRRIKAVLE